MKTSWDSHLAQDSEYGPTAGTNGASAMESFDPAQLERALDPMGSPDAARKQEHVKTELFDLFVELVCQKQPLELKRFMEDLEKCLILRVLLKAHGNQKLAAKILGIKYTTLNEKVKKYKIRFERRLFPLMS